MTEQSTEEAGTRGTARRRRLGVFVEWVHDGYSDPILDELVAAAKEHDFDVLCYVEQLNYEDVPVQTRHRPIAYAHANSMDAALVVSMGNVVNAAEIEKYFERFEPLPIVSIAVRWEKYPKVVGDDESGVCAGVRHLIVSHGRTRIACIRGPEVSREADGRFRAYRETLAENGIEFDPALVAIGSYIKPHGTDAVRLWIDERRVSFDAIVAANDAMAKGALEELHRRGIRVPHDVALIGFDDIDEARFWQPPLSTVRQPIREHARKAFESILNQLEGKTVPLTTSVRSQFVLRRSCGCIVSASADRTAPPPSQSRTNHEATSDFVQSSIEALLRFAGVDAPRNDEDERAPQYLIEGLKGDRAPFLRWLEQLLDDSIQRHIDVLGIFGVLRNLRQLSQHSLQSEGLESAESLLSDCDNIVAEVAERSQALRRYLHEDLFNELVRTNEALVHAVDMPSLQRILTQRLPRFGIRSCYLCLYEVANGQVPAENARVVLASNTERNIELPVSGLKFRTTEILPAAFMQSNTQSTWVICPLMRDRPEYNGYFVIERGTPEGYVYEGLLQQLGSAYERIELLSRLVTEVRLRERAERERLEKEMHLATRIQTSILPRTTQVDGLELATAMHPATEVGGDYYDIIPTDGGCWIGIGDVAGHGLPTGLVMMMLQSAVGGLVRHNVTASPKALLSAVNSLLYDNIRRRLGQDEHITLTLIRYERSGILKFSGAHEDILVCRANDGRVDCIKTPGVWTAALRDVQSMNDEASCLLDEGDIFLLYTDGITEARSRERELYGHKRLCNALARHREKPVSEIRDAILADVRAWMHVQDDDITLLVGKQNRCAVRFSEPSR